MIYTTYFDNIKNLPKNIIPISIAAKPPKNWKGLQYKVLSPTYEILQRWNYSRQQQFDEDVYIEAFYKEVLNKLNPQRVIHELMDLAEKEAYANFGYSMSPEPAPELALVCYERPNQFCHRHLVADWLNDNYYECKEFCV